MLTLGRIRMSSGTLNDTLRILLAIFFAFDAWNVTSTSRARRYFNDSWPFRHRAGQPRKRYSRRRLARLNDVRRLRARRGV